MKYFFRASWHCLFFGLLKVFARPSESPVECGDAPVRGEIAENGAITITVCSRESSKCPPEMASSHPHLKWLIRHIEALTCQLFGRQPWRETAAKQTRHINTVTLLGVLSVGVRSLDPGPVAWLAYSMTQCVIRHAVHEMKVSLNCRFLYNRPIIIFL